MVWPDPVRDPEACPKPICPTCGKTGPDTFTEDFDTGAMEATCGDEWHDRFSTSPSQNDNGGENGP